VGSCVSTRRTRIPENAQIGVITTTDVATTHSPIWPVWHLIFLLSQPMSDEILRVFSSAKLLLTDRRSRLKMDVIEANECLRSWYGRSKKGSFDYNASGKPVAAPLGPEVGCEDQGDEGADGQGDLQIPTQRLERGERRSHEAEQTAAAM
jgi:hypothetical protein